jgi:hypothetical protein
MNDDLSNVRRRLTIPFRPRTVSIPSVPRYLVRYEPCRRLCCTRLRESYVTLTKDGIMEEGAPNLAHQQSSPEMKGGY